MQITIDLDPAVYQAFEQRARTEHTTLNRLIARMLAPFATAQPLSPVESMLSNGDLQYQIPVSAGAKSFSSEDVARLEAEEDQR